jgi:long-chain acyl-CoA synthetase
MYICSGISIYYAESLETIADNLKEIRPDVFCTVPRLLEKVYEKIIAKGGVVEIIPPPAKPVRNKMGTKS